MEVTEVGQQNKFAAPIKKKIVRLKSKSIREAIQQKHREHAQMDSKPDFVSQGDDKEYGFS